MIPDVLGLAIYAKRKPIGETASKFIKIPKVNMTTPEAYTRANTQDWRLIEDH